MSRFLVVLALVSGCSVALQSKPKAGKVATSECSTTPAYWIADAVGVAAGVAAVSTGMVIGDSSDTGYLMAGAGAIASVLYLASAHNGYKWARQCGERTEAMPVAAR